MSIALGGPVTVNVPQSGSGDASAIKAVAIDTCTDKASVVWWCCAYADGDNITHTIWLPASCVADRSS